MPERDDAEPTPLPPDVRDYLRAFVAEERPSPRARATTWAAIEGELRQDRRRLISWGVGGLLALAAAVLLVLGMRGGGLERAPAEPSMQTPWEGRSEDGGAALERGPEPASTDDRRESPPPDHASSPETPSQPSPEPASAVTESRAARRGAPRASRPSEQIAAVAPEPSASTLAEELALVRRAKLALSRGETAKALEVLDEHRERFEDGALARERSVLRAEALCTLGRRTEAVAVRDAFLARHPTSPLAARVRDVCR
ncbi:MAG: hypothetical protein KC501_12605 [Myxococcales bacterium]|nr:hypothetical protein [Myxococcales bacterium]